MPSDGAHEEDRVERRYYSKEPLTLSLIRNFQLQTVECFADRIT